MNNIDAVNKIRSALIRYDVRQSDKPGFNRYALAQYMRRVDELEADLKAGAPLRAAIKAIERARIGEITR